MKRKYILSKNNWPLIYLLCLWFSVQTGVSSQYTLDQSASFLSIQERTYDDLNCTYQKKTFYNFVWFKQEPGNGLVYLSLIQSSQKEQADKNFKELLGKEKFYSFAYLSLPPWRLSYLLLCFAPQCSRSTCSLSHNSQLGLLTGI